MSGARPLLLNGGEQQVDHELRATLDAHELQLDVKTRVASILPLDNSGIDAADYSYGMRAEFDFVVSKGANRKPEFAVEFDGALHLTDPKTIGGDRRKERLCTRFDLPLLRIGVEALDRPRKETILAWPIDLYYLAEEFDRLQAEGVIAPDEPFTYFLIFDVTPGGHLGPSKAFDQKARLDMQAAHREGLAPGHVPEEVTIDIWDPDVRIERVESYAIFELDTDNFIIGHAAMRNFQRFGGISASQLATDLAVADAGDRLALYRRGRFRPMSAKGLAGIRARTAGWRRDGVPCGSQVVDG
jgi:hypothetical protein